MSDQDAQIEAPNGNPLPPPTGRGHEPACEQRVFADELRLIIERRKRLELERGNDTDEPDVRSRGWSAALLGLCLSGGGIRSATFNLGVLQALARYKLLRHVDYLSTVSGGGYIGGWLTAWLQRKLSPGKDSELSAQRENFKPEYEKLEKALGWSAGDGEAKPARGGDRQAAETREETKELFAIRNLRRFSNFLTPKLGVFSGDTWALISIYVRNVLLNQLVLLFALVIVLLSPRILSWLLAQIGGSDGDEILLFGAGGAALVSVVLIAYAVIRLGANLAGVEHPDYRKSAHYNTKGVLLHIVLPITASGVLLSAWAPILGDMSNNAWRRWIAVAVAFTIGNLIAQFVVWRTLGKAVPKDGQKDRRDERTGRVRTISIILLSAIVSGAFVLGPLMAASGIFLAGFDYVGYRVLMAMPLFVAALLLNSIVSIGIVGNLCPSLHREWLSRLGGLMGIVALAWLIVTALVFLSPLFIDLLPWYVDLPMVAGWITASISGVYLGNRSQAAVPTWGKRIVMVIAPWVFLAGLLTLVSAGLQALLNWAGTLGWDDVVTAGNPYFFAVHNHLSMSVVWNDYGQWMKASENIWLLLAFIVFAAVMLFVLSLRIDINSFSLHNLYANRIVRSFLGASVVGHRNNFTDFSRKDDLNLCALPGKDDLLVHEEPALLRAQFVPQQGNSRKNDWLRGVAYASPYHIVNTAINLVSADNLAWQERKAASFILSPLYCGFPARNDDKTVGAYRPTDRFSSLPHHLTLGEAIAVSGAAASPNMGYHTTPALSFLLGVFNIRLGRWVGNPKDANYWQRSGPRAALLHLLSEVLGMTGDKSNFVYLSDGGHFENLALYEMVRRRCRYVIVCDSGADGDYDFEDLGNAVRKCRIDLGVEIEIDVSEIATIDANGYNGSPCTVGKIHYADNQIGTLLYIKSSRRQGMPSDLRQYALQHSEFPHESTADQFFSESQFESYRRLGHFLATEILDAAMDDVEEAVRDENGEIDPGEFDLEQLFRRLEQNWYPPSEAISANFTKLTEQMDALFERLRTSKKLDFLNKQFYPEWRTLLSSKEPDLPAAQDAATWNIPDTDEEIREGFYFCNSLIQLMEGVYLDLNLESEWDHPDNSGWMNIFRHWTWSSMFRVTWAISAATYGRRFRAFCRQKLKLELGNVLATKIYDDSSTNPRLSECLKAHRLNVIEQTQIVNLLEAKNKVGPRGFDTQVYRLDLKVDKPANGGPLRRFGFGYALVCDTELIMYRVQDHLRNMELGRRGLESLLETMKPRHKRHGPEWLELRMNDREMQSRLEAISENYDRERVHEFQATMSSIRQKLEEE